MNCVALDDDLRLWIQTLVASYLDGQPVNGDLVTEPAAVRSGTAVVYIRLIDADPPVVRVFSPLLRDVDRGPELLAELNDLNARLSFLRLFWRDRTVYAAAELLAPGLTGETLTHAVDTVSDTADFYDERLQPRFGGEKAYLAPPAV